MHQLALIPNANPSIKSLAQKTQRQKPSNRASWALTLVQFLPLIVAFNCKDHNPNILSRQRLFLFPLMPLQSKISLKYAKTPLSMCAQIPLQISETVEGEFEFRKDMESLKGPGDVLQPLDTYKLAYIIHFLLGAGNLLPWNAFITAVDYFGYLYPTEHIEKVFSVAYMSSSVLVLVVVVTLGGWSRKLSLRMRMNVGFSLFILSLMVAPIIDWTSGGGSGAKRGGKVAYVITVSSVVMCGLADGLIGGSLIGSAGKLPKQYMQAVFAGTASSGVLVSILRIITKASLPQNPQGLRTSAYFYFLVSTFILLLCLVCSNLLYKLPAVRQHYTFHEDNLQCSRLKLWVVAEKIRLPALGIFMIYLVTLSIFPGFIAEDLKSEVLQGWYPVLLITIYNVADLAGKSLTAIYVMKSMKKATWGCISRLLFYPLFYVCLHGPNWLKTEAPMTTLTFMLGLTNGYLTSVLMILTPKSVPASEAEFVAIMMVVFLGIGLVSGSIFGWFWII